MKGKMKQIWAEMQRLRENPQGGIDITLAQHLREQYPELGKELIDSNMSSEEADAVRVSKLFAQLGVDPRTMTVDQTLTLDDDTRWLVPEVFREAIRKGLRKAPWYPNLVIREERIPQPTQQMPYIDLADAEAEELGEAQDIGEGTITYGSKSVTITKVGIGIHITYEAIQYTTLSLVSLFLQDVGVRLGLRLNKKCVTALITGDQADLSQNAAVIGVDNTTNKLVYLDEVRAHVRASLLGRLFSDIVTNEAGANRLLNLSEHKDRVQGTPLFPVTVRTPLPKDSNVWVDVNVPANQFVFVDPRYSLVQLTSAPLLVEGEKIVQKQVQGTFASITTGFANIFRDARLVMDESIAFSGNGFPTWMDPVS